jgi:hypothetical protein
MACDASVAIRDRVDETLKQHHQPNVNKNISKHYNLKMKLVLYMLL